MSDNEKPKPPGRRLPLCLDPRHWMNFIWHSILGWVNSKVVLSFLFFELLLGALSGLFYFQYPEVAILGVMVFYHQQTFIALAGVRVFNSFFGMIATWQQSVGKMRVYFLLFFVNAFLCVVALIPTMRLTCSCDTFLQCHAVATFGKEWRTVHNPHPPPMLWVHNHIQQPVPYKDLPAKDNRVQAKDLANKTDSFKTKNMSLKALFRKKAQPSEQQKEKAKVKEEDAILQVAAVLAPAAAPAASPAAAPPASSAAAATATALQETQQGIRRKAKRGRALVRQYSRVNKKTKRQQVRHPVSLSSDAKHVDINPLRFYHNYQSRMKGNGTRSASASQESANAKRGDADRSEDGAIGKFTPARSAGAKSGDVATREDRNSTSARRIAIWWLTRAVKQHFRDHKHFKFFEAAAESVWYSTELNEDTTTCDEVKNVHPFVATILENTLKLIRKDQRKAPARLSRWTDPERKLDTRLTQCAYKEDCDMVRVLINKSPDPRARATIYVCSVVGKPPMFAGASGGRPPPNQEKMFNFEKNKMMVLHMLQDSDKTRSPITEVYEAGRSLMDEDTADGLHKLLDAVTAECICDMGSGSNCMTYSDDMGNPRFWCWVHKQSLPACLDRNVAVYYNKEEGRYFSEEICRQSRCKCSGMGMPPTRQDTPIPNMQPPLWENQFNYGSGCGLWATGDKQEWCYVGFDSICADRFGRHGNSEYSFVSASLKKLNPQFKSHLPCDLKAQMVAFDKTSSRCTTMSKLWDVIEVIDIAIRFPMMLVLFKFLSNRCVDLFKTEEQFQISWSASEWEESSDEETNEAAQQKHDSQEDSDTVGSDTKGDGKKNKTKKRDDSDDNGGGGG